MARTMPGTIAQLGGLKAGSMLLAAVAASGFMLGRQSPVLFAAPPFFKDVVLESGTIQHEGARGAAWGDYDNDGDPDLFIAGEGDASRLYRNNGDGTFEDVTKQAGIMQTRSASSAVFGDFDNDGCRDLYVANEAVREQGTPDTLYRSNCDGTFT
ncbi:MAG: VCBS repeat-containing protein, partial [Candidatus Pacearchaeota archaeon]|nr:VCBS repeat-containing protein [Candidatus Pacearchaeota archaeon]